VVVVLLQFSDFLFRNCINISVQLVDGYRLDQILHGIFHLQVLALKECGLLSDMLLLHLHKFLDGERLCIWQVNKQCLGDDLEVLLNTVLNDVIDIFYRLLQLAKNRVDMGLISINIHTSPGKSDHSRS